MWPIQFVQLFSCFYIKNRGAISFCSSGEIQSLKQCLDPTHISHSPWLKNIVTSITRVCATSFQSSKKNILNLVHFSSNFLLKSCLRALKPVQNRSCCIITTCSFSFLSLAFFTYKVYFFYRMLFFLPARK